MVGSIEGRNDRHDRGSYTQNDHLLDLHDQAAPTSSIFGGKRTSVLNDDGLPRSLSLHLQRWMGWCAETVPDKVMFRLFRRYRTGRGRIKCQHAGYYASGA